MPLLRGTKAGAEFYCVGAERGGVGSHVRPWTRRYGATAIVPALAFSRARERYHPLGTGVISTRPDGRQKCKREQAHPSRLARHRFLGTGNRVLPWHVSTVHSFSLFLLRARTAHRFYFFFFFFYLFFFRRSRCIKTNEYKFVRHRISKTIVHDKSIYI